MERITTPAAQLDEAPAALSGRADSRLAPAFVDACAEWRR